jgi:methylisocitrate lyase
MNMNDYSQNATRFRALHIAGEPLILVNVWDAGSAKAVAAAGAKAIATSSWAVADANGFTDGEQMPRAAVLEIIRRMASTTTLPLTVDLESGYGDALSETIRSAIEAGAIGCNLEDSIPGDGKLRTIAEQCERIRNARRAAGAEFFLNIRTDVFFQKHEFAEAIERAQAYSQAGADGIFAPGLTDLDLIETLASACPLPLNIMTSEAGPSPRALAERGVARVSFGPAPYLAAMAALTKAATAAFA